MNSIIENLMRLARVRKTDLHLEELDMQKILGVVSQPSQGSTFYFTLPARESS